jgi:hydrophobe/amphiphile efflux-1 (HAE1) family protein
MFLSDTSIDRPVLTTVVMGAVLLAGWLGYRNLPVRELPDVEYPIVNVQSVFPGASAGVVETEVTEVLEEEINTIEGIKTLTSTSAEGVSIISAEFQLERDVDFALQDVRASVSRVRGELPDDVEDPIVQKVDPDAQPIIWVPVQNPDAGITEINDVADTEVRERLQTIEGVGRVILGGERRFAVRIDLDPQRMGAYGITVPDVRRALQSGNVEIPSGRVESLSREFTVRTLGEIDSPEAFADLIVGWRDEAPIRLGDVGRAYPGVQNERALARFNGETTVGVGVVKQSGANTVAVAERVLERLDEIRHDLPPGFTVDIAVNNADFIEQSLAEVEETIFIAFVLVVVVILLFLQSGTATIIPTAAIPVSIVGTFAALWALGFSVNTLTLLALVLAIGIVVDDAIVVVENIHRHLEEGKSAKEAAREGTSEIAFAVIAISLTLVIVFLPIAFMGGIVGRLFRQFGIAVAVSVLISAFVALSLSPMLSSRFLRLGHAHNVVFDTMDRAIEWLTDRYRATLEWALDHRWLVTAIGLVSLLLSLVVMARMGKEFVPPEDRGQFLVSVQAPVGSTLEYTDSYLRQIEGMLVDTEGVDRFFSAVGLGIGGPGSVASAIAFVRLEGGDRRSQFEIMDEVRGKVARLAGVDVFLIAPSSLQQGAGQPLQFVLQAPNLDTLAHYADSMVARARATPGLLGVDTDLDLNKPQLSVTIDRNKAASLGVSVADVGTTLQVLMGGTDITEFERGSERYEVMVQARDSSRVTPQDVSSLYVRGAGGGLVQLSSVVDVAEGVAPNQINHFNRRRSITVSSALQGISLGTGLERMQALADDVLPEGFTTTVTGQTQDFQESFASLVFALVMAVVAVYLVLAGQFESFVHPFTIMLALPLALVGAVLALALFGMTLNIYSMIGIIMLMGLVTKNSILLVDFANQARRGGMERDRAVVRAGVVRLRPIVMTSISIIIGVMPIALALGAGAESRRPLGVAVVVGMFSSTALTLLVVPVFYALLDDGLQWAGAQWRRLPWVGGEDRKAARGA